MLIFMAFFNGFGTGGVLSVASAYVIEFFPRKYRDLPTVDDMLNDVDENEDNVKASYSYSQIQQFMRRIYGLWVWLPTYFSSYTHRQKCSLSSRLNHTSHYISTSPLNQLLPCIENVRNTVILVFSCLFSGTSGAAWNIRNVWTFELYST
ncbi:hypothetical protein TrispH2_011342 [Trichoplax sp. H2]|nr:hypothetical protein TrispH2_011342 [Trichoplax sp. H2]|eukprot:RDD36689.1 hypothetical protein TrispH2_011342 [Trichoplax sp. H2]